MLTNKQENKRFIITLNSSPKNDPLLWYFKSWYSVLEGCILYQCKHLGDTCKPLKTLSSNLCKTCVIYVMLCWAVYWPSQCWTAFSDFFILCYCFNGRLLSNILTYAFNTMELTNKKLAVYDRSWGNKSPANIICPTCTPVNTSSQLQVMIRNNYKQRLISIFVVMFPQFARVYKSA